MSWSFEHTSTVEAVKKATTETLDKIAAGYSGNEQAKDIVAVKERVLSLIDSLELGNDGYTDWNACTVRGNGTHSTSTKGIVAATCQYSVARASLKLV